MRWALTMVIQGLLNKRELSQSAHLSSGGQKHPEHPVFEGLNHSPTITVIGNAIESMSSLNWGVGRKASVHLRCLSAQ